MSRHAHLSIATTNVLNTAVGTAPDEDPLNGLTLGGLATLEANVLHGPGDYRPPPLVLPLILGGDGHGLRSAMTSADFR